MVVNDPYGNFYCVDDSFGTVNPTIDFNNPAGGTTDVWVGSYASGTGRSGTFYVTENSGNPRQPNGRQARAERSGP